MLSGALGMAGAAVLAGCSSGKSASSTSTTGLLSLSSDSANGNSQDDYVLLQIFSDGPYVYPGAPQRLAFALANGEGAFLDTGPASLEFVVVDGKDRPVGSPITVALHDKGLQKGYYPLVFDPPATGDYTAKTSIKGKPLTAAFQVFDKSKITALGAGAAMPSIPTPTVADHQGVDPICTASPQCPFHTVSLDAALKAAKPVAVLIATPAYCQTAICGPVLDVLVSQKAAFGERITLIHNEVYKSGAIASKNISAPGNLTPLIAAMKLEFEPTLVLVNADGTIKGRLDNVFDQTEAAAALNSLAG